MDVIRFKQHSTDQLLFCETVYANDSRSSVACLVKVDTGAAWTTIGKELVSENTLSSLNFNENIKTVGGSAKTALTRLPLITLGNCVLRDIDVHVNKLWEIGEPEGKKVLLGLDVLKYFDYAFDSSKNIFKISLSRNLQSLPFTLYKNTSIRELVGKDTKIKGF